MTLALATGAAILLSAVATALLALVLIVLFNIPFVVALPLVAIAYVSIWLIIPLCLAVNLIGAALSRKDLPIHIAAIVAAGLLWLTWGALFPNHQPGERPLLLITASAALASVPVHWAAFLWAQRRRRREAAMPQAST